MGGAGGIVAVGGIAAVGGGQRFHCCDCAVVLVERADWCVDPTRGCSLLFIQGMSRI